MTQLLELRGLTKKFGAFAALSEVDFAVGAGEIVGLLGENGAGKSTLMNIVGGVLRPTSGELLWHGQPLHLKSPREATRRGIGIVHQHFMLVPVFTVAENLALHTPGAGALYSAAVWKKRVEAWGDSLGWRIDGDRLVADLSVGERQRVEILKALFNGAGEGADNAAELLLLDEPTANLTPDEVAELFGVLRRLRDQGRGVVFVSHKLNEVMELCDRVVVLRHGRVTGQRPIGETNVREMAELMVGRELQAPRPRPAPTEATPPCLSIEKLTHGQLRDFSLTVHRGEIVGLAGVDGNGQQELMEVLGNLQTPESGRVSPSVSEFGVIPQDRHHVGLILEFDLAENMALHPALRQECHSTLGFKWKQARQQTRELIKQFDVRTPARQASSAPDRAVASSLSGGNQQKVVIARALTFPHTALVAADPTRGLDIGATTFVREQLRRAAEEGAGVLLISTDLDEIMELCDRIGVLYEGRLLPDEKLLPASAGRAAIGALMGGHTPQDNGDTERGEGR